MASPEGAGSVGLRSRVTVSKVQHQHISRGREREKTGATQMTGATTRASIARAVRRETVRQEKVAVVIVEGGRSREERFGALELFARLQLNIQRTNGSADNSSFAEDDRSQASADIYRDLRDLLSGFSLKQPSIEVRRGCLLLNMPPFRCAVLADKVFLLPPLWDPLLVACLEAYTSSSDSLAQTVPGNGNGNTGGRGSGVFSRDSGREGAAGRESASLSNTDSPLGMGDAATSRSFFPKFAEFSRGGDTRAPLSATARRPGLSTSLSHRRPLLSASSSLVVQPSGSSQSRKKPKRKNDASQALVAAKMTELEEKFLDRQKPFNSPERPSAASLLHAAVGTPHRQMQQQQNLERAEEEERDVGQEGHSAAVPSWGGPSRPFSALQIHRGLPHRMSEGTGSSGGVAAAASAGLDSVAEEGEGDENLTGDVKIRSECIEELREEYQHGAEGGKENGSGSSSAPLLSLPSRRRLSPPDRDRGGDRPGNTGGWWGGWDWGRSKERSSQGRVGFVRLSTEEEEFEEGAGLDVEGGEGASSSHRGGREVQRGRGEGRRDGGLQREGSRVSEAAVENNGGYSSEDNGHLLPALAVAFCSLVERMEKVSASAVASDGRTAFGIRCVDALLCECFRAFFSVFVPLQQRGDVLMNQLSERTSGSGKGGGVQKKKKTGRWACGCAKQSRRKRRISNTTAGIGMAGEDHDGEEGGGEDSEDDTEEESEEAEESLSEFHKYRCQLRALQARVKKTHGAIKETLQDDRALAWLDLSADHDTDNANLHIGSAAMVHSPEISARGEGLEPRSCAESPLRTDGRAQTEPRAQADPLRQTPIRTGAQAAETLGNVMSLNLEVPGQEREKEKEKDGSLREDRGRDLSGAGGGGQGTLPMASRGHRRSTSQSSMTPIPIQVSASRALGGSPHSRLRSPASHVRFLHGGRGSHDYGNHHGGPRRLLHSSTALVDERGYAGAHVPASQAWRRAPTAAPSVGAVSLATFRLARFVPEEAELVLEDYARELEQILQELDFLDHELDNGVQLMTLRLAVVRNDVMKVDLGLTVIATTAALSSVVASVLGMNLKNGYEDSMTAFLYAGSFCMAPVVLSVCAVALLLRSHLRLA
uniref:Magnesium transporter n=1 Tax=Chromera velia CCMP2878 TaxID=1169474 RepID=A0A0G4GH95_9ALVE|eukprot:Cvel_4707.t1-p1 / transcript=Cvel_4707.t1 / gene=Cvel_4707 / organism=Chromera_velia_CCMP2878 / gene_product=hypothetical protein / transcript_product=hypothetical protein / location=Cvel_scaffold209:58947-66111(-) / protein_length=1106 / sequence_SO=supercontig / SO=protein_coding / is_pseudo=false